MQTRIHRMATNWSHPLEVSLSQPCLSVWYPAVWCFGWEEPAGTVWSSWPSVPPQCTALQSHCRWPLADSHYTQSPSSLDIPSATPWRKAHPQSVTWPPYRMGLQCAEFLQLCRTVYKSVYRFGWWHWDFVFAVSSYSLSQVKKDLQLFCKPWFKNTMMERSEILTRFDFSMWLF